jgi:hypothetical protein
VKESDLTTSNQDAILKTLQLHGTAINTALQRQLALEARVEELQRVTSSSARTVTASGLAGLANGLEGGLKLKGPEDGKPVIYFFHIPKTSGTSFHRFLTGAFGEASVSPLRTWDDVLAYCGSGGNWRVWSGHFGGLLPFILPTWPRMVTILRDPVERAISFMNHVQRDTAHPYHAYAKGMGVLEYCRHPKLRRSVDNVQARYLASLSFALMVLRREGRGDEPFDAALFSMDPEHSLLDSAIRAISHMDMVGLCEAHRETLRLFARKFNVPGPVEPYSENRAGPSQLKKADLSREELECVQELAQIDQLVYEHARSRFERDCRLANLTYETC